MFYRFIQIVLVFFVFVCGQIDYGYAGTRISERKKEIKKTEAALVKENVNIDVSQLSSLDDYTKAGLKNNPGIKASFYKWKSAFKKISQVFSLPDPQFTYTEYIEEVETRVGPQERAYSIKQKFPLPDKIWIRKNRAFRASETAFQKFEMKRLELTYKIADVYYEHIYLGKAILLMQENIKLLKNFENVAQARYRSALTQNHDLLKVQVELGKLENDLFSLRDLRVPLVARLNTLLNLPKDNPLPWSDESLEDIIIDSKYEKVEMLYSELKEKNPEILALSESVEKAKDSVKLAIREFFPDLTVGVTQVDTGDAMKAGTIDSGKDPLMVMFSVNVPIWFNRLNAEVQDARASLKTAENLLEDKKNELISQLALIHYKLRDSLRQSQLYKDALLPKAVQVLNATQLGYESGKVEFLSLIDAQRVLLNFQLAYYRYNANFYQRFAELKSLLGEIEAGEE